MKLEKWAGSVNFILKVTECSWERLSRKCSILFVLSLAVVWRGPWNSRDQEASKRLRAVIQVGNGKSNFRKTAFFR